jgi:DNA-binding FrmR family transcriptional regulator
MHGLMMEVLVDHLDEHVVAEQDQDRRREEAQVLLKLLQGYAK